MGLSPTNQPLRVEPIEPSPQKTLDYRRRGEVEPGQQRSKEDAQHAVWEYWVPTALLIAGVALVVGILIQWRTDPRDVPPMIASYFSFQAIVLAVTVPLLSRVIGGFGLLSSGLLKLAALSIFPIGIIMLTMLLWGPCFGLVGGPPIAFVIATGLFMKMFDLDVSEGMFCVAATWGLALGFHSIGWWVSDWVFRLWR
jgi:hypothetical protein